tara:strand:+ start:69746 stop:70804 length:1059 start_codon:yes stop_codon:yes gene_type:complete
MHKLLALAVATTLASPLAAQITYVDADETTNTTFADGTPMVTTTANLNDDVWRARTFANGGTIYSSCEAGTPGEDCPMLRTTITGLIPTLPYNIYAYFWNADNAGWRGRAQVDTAQPTSPLPGYNGAHFAGSAFEPMTSLSITTPAYNGLNPRLDLTPDPSGFEIEGHFANTGVLLIEGNRLLCEVYVGTFEADFSGNIDVYIDDLANTVDFNRTWYDGVGYELAPLTNGLGCGNPVPTIGHAGPPIYNLPFELTLTNAPANAIALPVVGLSNSSWNGVPLPLDLGLVGLTPGCPLNVRPDILGNLLTDANGDCVFTVNLPTFTPFTVYWQWGVLTAAGLSMTPALETLFHR